jgi:hypothetical protein
VIVSGATVVRLEITALAAPGAMIVGEMHAEGQSEMPKRDGVRLSLSREAAKAQERFKTEAAKFNTVVHDLPIPYPDSVTRITVAAREHNNALEAYRTAMKRLNDYALHGIIPDALDEGL